MQHRSFGKWLILALACAAGGLLSRDTLAGVKANHFVSIVGLTAQGALGSARNSTGTNQRIGCTIHQGDNGGLGDGQPDGVCFARDAAGTVLVCLTDNQEFLPLIDSIDSLSHIKFTADASGQCTFLQTAVSSSYAVPVL
jgi:hypothetical protein